MAALALLGHWSEDEPLLAALQALPTHLDAALRMDWSAALEPCCKAKSLYTVGRGGLAIAAEAALKFKEVAILHAECFSGAEIAHGPVSLVEPGFPALVFLAADPSRPGLQNICGRLYDTGATVLAVGVSPFGTRLPHAAAGHVLTELLSMMLSFYAFAERLAREKCLDPDTPCGLKKVTETT